MNTRTAISFAALVCIGSAAAAQSTPMATPMMDTVPKMTMQQCKDYMAMKKTDAMKADKEMMMKDKMCADMMKKDGMKDGGSMMNDAASAPKM